MSTRTSAEAANSPSSLEHALADVIRSVGAANELEPDREGMDEPTEITDLESYAVRRRLLRLQAFIGRHLGSSPATTSLTSDHHEAIHRAAFGCVPLPPNVLRVNGVFDAWTADGIGWSLKLGFADKPRVEQELWAELMEAGDFSALLMSGEGMAGTDPITTTIHYSAIRSGPIQRAAGQGSAAAVGRMVIDEVTRSLQDWMTEREVTEPRFGLLLRDRSEHWFAWAEAPIEFLASDAYRYHWTAGKRSVIAIEKKSGRRLFRFTPTSGQLDLDLHIERSAFARFGVAWEAQSWELAA